jgi:ribonuclease HI
MTKPKSLGGLGFRDIELFNLALLAKQAWRMVQDPNALSARILKSVYFPNGEFLEAEVGSHPSRVWRAIVEGKEVLKQGLISRIGNGLNTNIWNSNWIPRDGMLRPLVCSKEDPPMMVAELIEAQTRSWDMEKINFFMAPMDAEVICNIPLPSRSHDDKWAWHYDKKGVFSVRSAYRMLVDARERRTAWLDERGGRSDVKGLAKEWSSLWNIKVPSKIRVFLWRLARHSLPTADVLHHRHMAPQNLCALCGAQDSWRHSLIDCNMARCVWALLPEDLVELIININEPDAKGWLAAVIDAVSPQELTRVVVTMWAIWHARRKALHEDIYQSPFSTLCFIDRFIADLAPPPKLKQAVAATPRWLAPPAGVTKVNVDAALSKNGGTAAVAAVARDADGTFLGASAVASRGVTDPETMEALACREGLALAFDLNVRRLRLASDCANVVRAIKAGSELVSYGKVVHEVVESGKLFQSVEFVFERRSSNKDAHNLARGSVHSAVGRHVWFLNPPDGVCNSVN